MGAAMHASELTSKTASHKFMPKLDNIYDVESSVPFEKQISLSLWLTMKPHTTAVEFRRRDSLLKAAVSLIRTEKEPGL